MYTNLLYVRIPLPVLPPETRQTDRPPEGLSSSPRRAPLSIQGSNPWGCGAGSRPALRARATTCATEPGRQVVVPRGVRSRIASGRAPIARSVAPGSERTMPATPASSRSGAGAGRRGPARPSPPPPAARAGETALPSALALAYRHQRGGYPGHAPASAGPGPVDGPVDRRRPDNLAARADRPSRKGLCP